MQRAPAKSKRYPYCTLVLSLEPRQSLLLLKEDACTLHLQGKLQKVLDDNQTAYCPPRSWRQICHGLIPVPHPDVLALAAKAANRTAGAACPSCGAISGDNWKQCNTSPCPMGGREATARPSHCADCATPEQCALAHNCLAYSRSTGGHAVATQPSSIPAKENQ